MISIIIIVFNYAFVINNLTYVAGAAMAAKQRRHLGQIRDHPYQRAGALS